MIKVFLAIPCGELSRFAEFWMSVKGLTLPEGVMIHPASNVMRSSYISNNQNWLARAFMASDADYYWLLNDDQLYPAPTLARLLSYQKDVIVPLCVRHDLPCEPLIYDRVDPKCPDNYLYHFLQKDEPELLEIVAAGGGGMLIHRRVFEAIPDPWWETHTVRIPGEPPTQSTEDFDFCAKVRQAGFKIWAAMNVPVGHSTLFTLVPARTAEGDWVTVFHRSHEQFAIPAAVKPVAPAVETPELVAQS